MKEIFELKETFAVSPEILYQAWLSSTEHSKMTDGEAKCSNQLGDSFSAWDAYITGKNLALIPNKEIVQSWRTTEFNAADESSQITIRLTAIENGTELTLIHSNIPEGQTQYKQGWIDHYFTPMQTYFGK